MTYSRFSNGTELDLSGVALNNDLAARRYNTAGNVWLPLASLACFLKAKWSTSSEPTGHWERKKWQCIVFLFVTSPSLYY